MSDQAQPPSVESISSIHRTENSGSKPITEASSQYRTSASNSAESGSGESKVVAPDAGTGEASTTTGESLEEVTSMVQQPAKVMRIGTMIKQLLEEVRAAPLDESGRARLREIHESSITELEQGLSPDLRAELRRLSLPFGDGIPSEAELRIAQAQLVGWLEGLFHGIQAAFAQQVVVRQHELEDRRALPPGMAAAAGAPGGGRVVIGPGGQIITVPGEGSIPGPDRPGSTGGTGQYL
jgi:hypothetical protein